MGRFTECSMFMLYRWGITWRLKGYGFILRRVKPDDYVMFSERYGYKKVYRLAGWRFEWLKP